MSERGIVLEVDGDQVVIRMERTEACAKCKACIAGLTKQEMLLRAKNLCGASVNDLVEIELETNFFIRSTLIMYGLPLVSMMAGFMGGFYFSGRFAVLEPYAELIGFGMGILMIFGAYKWINCNEPRWKSKNVIPVAKNIVSNTPLSL